MSEINDDDNNLAKPGAREAFQV